ncbi:phosphoglycerate kinase [Patescibacteria group bacterium]
MNIPDIKQASLEGKRILMRVDFNVKFLDGKPEEIYKIKSAKKTIDYILSKPGVKLALVSHLGRPEPGEIKLSFVEIRDEISKILGRKIVFTSASVGEPVGLALENLEEGEILMLENIRFFEKEMLADESFAQDMAENFDIYINEAFSVSHRDHASLTTITNFLPSFLGFNFIREIEELNKLRQDFKKPAVALIGGIKVDTKLPMIEFFSKIYDQVLVGGGLGIEIQDRKIDVGPNVILPDDYLGDGLDIGPKTIEKFKRIISDSKTIVWNGPLGKFEDAEYVKGTKEILHAIAENKDAYKVAGGGETIQVLEEIGLLDKFDFVSTGGGAMLDFLADGSLPALEALKHEKRSTK